MKTLNQYTMQVDVTRVYRVSVDAYSDAEAFRIAKTLTPNDIEIGGEVVDRFAARVKIAEVKYT